MNPQAGQNKAAPGPTLLLVDDSPVMRSFLRRALSVCGFPVGRFLEAGNGQQALAVLGEQRADMVLTDINMPVMDGERLLLALRDDPALGSIPVVVVSTDATDSRRNRLLSLGAAGYLTKPFEPERLAELLGSVLTGAQGEEHHE
jgi:two-component system, chemotaxis family, chemotaxis protein CheY